MTWLYRHPHATAAAAAAIATGTLVAIAWAIGFGAVGDVFARFDPPWIALLLGGEGIAYVGYSFGYRGVVRLCRGPELPLLVAGRLVAAGFGPFAAGGGFHVDHQALHAVSRSRRDATIRVLGLGALEYAVLAPATAVAALVLALRGGPLSLTVPWIVCVPAGTALAFHLVPPERRPGWMCRGRTGEIADVILASVGALRDLARERQRHGSAYVGITVYWIGEIAALYGALRLFGTHLAVDAVIVGYSTGQVMTRRSLPLGGAGPTDALMVAALRWVRLPYAAALPAVAAYRAVNLGLSLLPALGARPTVQPLVEGVDGPPPELARAARGERSAAGT